MFRGLKDMAGLAGAMKDLPRIKAKLDEIKQRLAEETAVGESGGGAVRVTANGQLRVVSVQIDPALLSGLVDVDRADDRALAEDLIAGAVNAALQKARELAEASFAQAATDLGLPIPPGALSGLIS